MSQDFVYGPRPRKQLGHPRQWYSHTRLASTSCRSAPDYINRTPGGQTHTQSAHRGSGSTVPTCSIPQRRVHDQHPHASLPSTASHRSVNMALPSTHTSFALHCKIVTQQTRSHTSLCCSHSLDSGRHDLWTHNDPDVRPAASKRGRGPTQSRPLAAVALWSPRAPSSMMESPRPAPTRVTPEHTVTSPGNITSPPTHTSLALHCSSVKQKTRTHTFFFVALTALRAAGIA